MAHILHRPDMAKPFITEVDASETGVRVVLAQSLQENPKLSPVAFYAKKLTMAE